MRFSCQPGCTKCCTRRGWVYLTEDDLLRAAEYLQMTAADFEAAYVIRFRRVLRLRKPAGRQLACHFLKDGGCSIHPVKPTQCRTYPFWPSLVNSRAAWKIDTHWVTTSVAANPVPTSPLSFIPVTPCRVADTRDAPGQFGGPIMSAGSTREFDVPASACNIPANALAYAMNVTVVPDKALNYLTVWPTGELRPVVSTLNSDGRIKANSTIVPAGKNGGMNVFVTDNTHVILDISGYFVPTNFSTSGLQFFPVTPCRIADTRLTRGALGGPSLQGTVKRDFPVLLSPCQIPASAQAYSLNVTVVPQSFLLYVTMWPGGQPQPLASILNAPNATTTANAAIIPAGLNGTLSAYASSDTDLVIDING